MMKNYLSCIQGGIFIVHVFQFSVVVVVVVVVFHVNRPLEMSLTCRLHSALFSSLNELHSSNLVLESLIVPVGLMPAMTA